MGGAAPPRPAPPPWKPREGKGQARQGEGKGRRQGGGGRGRGRGRGGGGAGRRGLVSSPGASRGLGTRGLEAGARCPVPAGLSLARRGPPFPPQDLPVCSPWPPPAALQVPAGGLLCGPEGPSFLAGHLWQGPGVGVGADVRVSGQCTGRLPEACLPPRDSQPVRGLDTG